MKKFLFAALLISLMLFTSTCTPESPQTQTISITIQPETQVSTDLHTTSEASATTLPSPGKTGTVPLTPNPQFTHRIGVRLVEGEAEFFDRQTGDIFIPRGFNYVRLAPMSKNNPDLWHSTLNPGFYDPERAGAALQEMHAAGYNVVRIFVDCCREGNNAGDPAGGFQLPTWRMQSISSIKPEPTRFTSC